MIFDIIENRYGIPFFAEIYVVEFFIEIRMVMFGVIELLTSLCNRDTRPFFRPVDLGEKSLKSINEPAKIFMIFFVFT